MSELLVLPHLRSNSQQAKISTLTIEEWKAEQQL